jgi:hypothetical protein
MSCVGVDDMLHEAAGARPVLDTCKPARHFPRTITRDKPSGPAGSRMSERGWRGTDLGGLLIVL